MKSTTVVLKKLRSCLYVCTGGIGLFSAYNIYQGNEKFYESFVVRGLHYFSPETAHNIGVFTSKYRLLPKSKDVDSQIFESNIWGLKFKNPIGIAAGFDKHGEAVEGLHDIGFGFVEIGSVTPQPQPGNEKPRVFRLEENQAVINSPNTPGLRDWQKRDQLEKLLKNVIDARNSLECQNKPPLLLKLAPDLNTDEKKDIVQVLSKKECRVDGLIISNTTVSRGPELTGPHVNEVGGLSGAPLCNLSTDLIREMYTATEGKIPIIGVGGVFSGEDAYEKILAGASLIQIYTAFIYHGPPRISRIKTELHQLLQRDGFTSVSDAVGKRSKNS